MTIEQIIDQAAEKYIPGNEEFKRVLHAIVLAESNGDPDAEGDNGNSIGLFQNNMAGGRGAGYTIEQLKDPIFNANLAAQDLARYFKDGIKRGLRGKDLTAFVSRTGQRPAAGLEQNAAKNYGRKAGQGSVAVNQPEQVLGVQQPKAKDIAYDESLTYQDLSGKTWKFNTRTQEYEQPGHSPLPTKTPVKKQTTKAPPRKEGIMEKFKGLFSQADLVPSAYAGYTSPQQNTNPYPSYTVRPGDTLWGIAQKYLGSGDRWQELTGYSGQPRQLPVGQKINIPANQNTPQGPRYVPPPSQQRPSQPVQSLKLDYTPAPLKKTSASLTPKPQPAIQQYLAQKPIQPIKQAVPKPTSNFLPGGSLMSGYNIAR